MVYGHTINLLSFTQPEFNYLKVADSNLALISFSFEKPKQGAVSRQGCESREVTEGSQELAALSLVIAAMGPD